MTTRPMGSTMLGYLTWTHVAGSELTYNAMEGLGVQLPSRPLPVDVFRRVTGVDGRSRYALEEGQEVVIQTITMKPPSDKMLVRHIVAEIADSEGITVSIVKVGDVAFYKPPKGQHSRARLRVTTNCSLDGIRKPVEAFAEALRGKYETGVAGQLDDQAVRRLVRNHLVDHAQALYLEGPYFTLDTDALEPLYPLFELLGPGSMIHTVPMPDTEKDRALIKSMLDRSEARATTVDQRIHRLIEKEPS